jgi:outer membrane protein TolC
VRAEHLLLIVALAGCGPARVLTRPDGDGGWSPARRQEELDARAASARVSLAGEPVAAPEDPSEALSLGEVVQLASTQSRRLAEADRDVAIAGARVSEARGRLFPALSADGRYTWYSDPQIVGITLPPQALRLLGGTAPGIPIREQDFGVVNGTATVPIDVFGEITKRLTATQAGYRAEEARRFATLLDEQVAAVRAYFGLLEVGRLRDVEDLRLAAERVQLKNAESGVSAGRLTRNELLVVQVAVRNSEQLVRQLDLEGSRARWSLNTIIGRPVDAPTRVVDIAVRPVLPATDHALTEAYAHNPLLLALVEEQQRLQDQASALSRSRLPQVQGGGAIDYSSSDIIQPQEIASGFVGFSWNFDTGGVKQAQIAQARIAADQNRVRIESSLREVESIVRSTRQAAEERLAALASAETAVLQAEENRRIRSQQFDVGRATSEDVLDAEALLAQQRAVLASALYQAHTRRAELQQVMGLPLDAIVEERGNPCVPSSPCSSSPPSRAAARSGTTRASSRARTASSGAKSPGGSCRLRSPKATRCRRAR